jgi:hypothetical protein
MFDAVLSKLADVAYSAGKVEAEAQAETSAAIGEGNEAFSRGFDSRDAEVDELKDTINRLTADVVDLVTQAGAMESKLREGQTASFNSGVESGRDSEITKAA